MLMRTALVLVKSVASAGLFVATCVFLRRKFGFSRAAIGVGSVQLAAVLVNAWAIKAAMLKPGAGEALMGWLWFDLVDLPLSFLQLPICMLPISFTLREVLLQILFFGVVGSFQYLAIAELFARRFRNGKGTRD